MKLVSNKRLGQIELEIALNFRKAKEREMSIIKDRHKEELQGFMREIETQQIDHAMELNKLKIKSYKDKKNLLEMIENIGDCFRQKRNPVMDEIQDCIERLQNMKSNLNGDIEKKVKRYKIELERAMLKWDDQCALMHENLRNARDYGNEKNLEKLELESKFQILLDLTNK